MKLSTKHGPWYVESILDNVCYVLADSLHLWGKLKILESLPHFFILRQFISLIDEPVLLDDMLCRGIVDFEQLSRFLDGISFVLHDVNQFISLLVFDFDVASLGFE